MGVRIMAQSSCDKHTSSLMTVTRLWQKRCQPGSAREIWRAAVKLGKFGRAGMAAFLDLPPWRGIFERLGAQIRAPAAARRTRQRRPPVAWRVRLTINPAL